MEQPPAGRPPWSLGAAAAVLAIYAATLWLMPKNVFWSPDEGGKYYAAAAVSWNGEIRTVPPYPPRAIDAELRFYPRGPRFAFPYPAPTASGGLAFHWPLGFPLLTRGMEEVFGLTGIWIVPLFCGWVAALLCGWLASRIERQLAAPAILLAGLATPLWFYSLTLWEHTAAAALGLLGLAPLFAGWARSARSLAAVLLPSVAASLLRIEMIFFALAASLVWAARGPSPAHAPRTASGWFTLGAVVGLVAALLWLLSVSALDRHWNLVLWTSERLGARDLTGSFSRTLTELWVNSAVHEGPAVSSILVGATAVALVVVWIAGAWLGGTVAGVLLVVSLAVVLCLSLELLFSPQSYRALHSIFGPAPYLALWPLALRRGPGEARVRSILSLAVVYLVLGSVAIYVAHTDVFGGLTTGLEWGQRYLLPLYPLGAILSLIGLWRHWRTPHPLWRRTAVGVLGVCMMVAAVGLQVRGLVMLASNRQMFASWERALPRAEPVVTDVWWVPATLAPFFTSHEAYYVRSPDELNAWAAWAAERGVEQFSLMTLLPPSDIALELGGRRCQPSSVKTVNAMRLAIFDLGCGGAGRTRPAAPPLP